jgi:hypothetical protein
MPDICKLLLATNWRGCRTSLNSKLITSRDLLQGFFRVDLLGSHAAQDARGLTGEVGQDDVSAGTPQAHERLHHHLLLVDHAQRPAGFDHRVLARNLNKGRGISRLRHTSVPAKHFR